MIQSLENKSSALYDMDLNAFLQHNFSLNSIFLIMYYLTVSYNTVNYQNLANFCSEGPHPYILINNSIRMVNDQMWYQMI